MAQAQLLYIGTTEGVVIASNPGRTDRWITVGIELPNDAIVGLSCDADEPMKAIVWTSSAAWTTDDGGQTWHPVAEPTSSPAPRTALVFAGSPSAALRISGDGLMVERSGDAGESWQPLELDSVGQWTVIAAPAYHPDTAYLGSADGAVWQTTDRGRTWQRIKRDLAAVTALALGRVLS